MIQIQNAKSRPLLSNLMDLTFNVKADMFVFKHHAVTGYLTNLPTMQHPYGLFTAFLRHEEYRSAPYEWTPGLVWARTIFVQNIQGSARTGPMSVMWLGIDKI